MGTGDFGENGFSSVVKISANIEQFPESEALNRLGLAR